MPGDIADVGIPVYPILTGFGAKVRQELNRDPTLGRVGSEHGKSYGAAAVKSGGGAVKAGMGAVWRGVAAAGAAVGIGHELSEAVKGWQAHQKVVAQSAQAIRSTGGAAHVSVGQVSALSDALERKTTVDGDVIQSGANMLLTFTNVQNRVGKGNDIFNRATQTVLDMSVALGTDAPSSAIQLGKALNDPIKGVTALQRVGVTFTDQQRKQIKAMQDAGNIAGAQKVVLAELTKEFGGSAKAQGDALGASGRLNVAWRQAQDSIGKALLPAVNGLAGALADRLPGAADKAARAIPKITAGAQGLYDLVVKGDFTGKFGKAFHVEEDSASVGRILELRHAVIGLSEKLRAVDFHTAAVRAGEFYQQVKGIDFAHLYQQIKSIDTAKVGQGFQVAGRLAGFLADHVDLLVKAMPFLIAGFLAYRGAQAAANVAALAHVPIQAANVVGNILLARSIKSLAVAQREQTATTVVGEGVQLASTAIQNLSTASLIRARVATLAGAAASKVAAVASLVFAGATRAVGIAMTFATGPVGIVILAVAAAAAGLIYAYRHSEKFRAVVNGAFAAVGSAARALWEHVLRPTFSFIIGAWLTVAGGIINGAAKAFGWVPGIGGKLKAAAAEFNRFRDQVNGALAGVKSRKVTVSATLTAGPVGRSSYAAEKGWRIPGYGGGDTVPIMAERGEAIIPKHHVPEIASWAREKGIPGFATGGIAGGLTVRPQLDGMSGFRAALSKFNAGLDAAVRKMVPKTQPYSGGGGAAQWTSTVLAVLAALGQSPGNLGAVLRRIQFESGGNPNAINLWDSNARAGHPSQGLMQTIPGTFNAYANGYRNRGITDPFANIYAGLAYAISRYGSIASIDPLSRPRGYRAGLAYVPSDEYPAMLHRGERVLTAEQNQAYGRPVVVQLVVDGKVLAESLLTEERRGGPIKVSRS